MKILRKKWYWARRLHGHKCEVWPTPYIGKKKAWADGVPGYHYGIEVLRGSFIVGNYKPDELIDMTQPEVATS